MTSRWLISSLIVIVSSLFIHQLINVCTRTSHCRLFWKKESVDLVVLVLSARTHFDKRKVLRETWFNDQNVGDLRIRPYFVVGNRDCPIPYEYREDVFGCTPWTFNETEDTKRSVFSHQASINPKSVDQLTFNGFSFKVHQDILLKRIGCLSSCICDNLILKNLITHETLYNQSFRSNNQIQYGYDYQNIIPIMMLPKGFVGLLIATGKDSECQTEQINHWNRYTKLTQILRVYNNLNDFESQPFNGYDEVKISFEVELSDQSEYQRTIENEKKIYGNYINQSVLMDKKLLNEVNEFHDILLVDVVDVYRNLPRKLVSGISRILSTHITELIMKTDDDCYIDMDRVTSKVKALASRESIWWGNFRRNSLINVYGKWSENDFPGSVYPSFACGSGYIISMDIAQWISRNQDHLHYFQGEDVSMGIWLSSIIPNYLMDRDWACAEDHTRDGLLAYCQLNSSQILQFDSIKSSNKHRRLLKV